MTTSDVFTPCCDELFHQCRIGCGVSAAFHAAVEISQAPGCCRWIVDVSWHEVQVQVLGAFAKGNCIHPLTARQALHELTRQPNG